MNFEGNGEVTGNIAGTPDNIDIFAAECAEINRSSSMPTQFVAVARDAYYIELVKNLTKFYKNYKIVLLFVAVCVNI